MAEQFTNEDLLAFTTEIVSSHVSNNTLPAEDLTALIKNVYKALATLTVEDEKPAEEPRQPAVAIKKSVFPDYIVCLEDGKKLKMLKRHLKTAYNMTPEEYRARWNLPADYPLVAPNYAERRSDLAKKIGLGNHRKKD